MKNHENKIPATRNKAIVNESSAKQTVDQKLKIADKRSGTVAQKKFQEMANNSKPVNQLKSLQAIANNYVVQQKTVTQLLTAEEIAKTDSKNVKANISAIARALTVFENSDINNEARKIEESALYIMSSESMTYIEKINLLSTKQDEIRKLITKAKKLDDENDAKPFIVGRQKKTDEEIERSFVVLNLWELK